MDVQKTGNIKKTGSPSIKPFSKKGSHAPLQPRKAFPAVQTGTGAPSKELPADQRLKNIDEDRSLTVGKGICLSGEISNCQLLLIHGQVEATISEADLIQISSSGFFKGEAKVKNADISGKFEGKLSVDGTLIIRQGGVVCGDTCYEEIIIEAGGKIKGKMSSLDEEQDPA